MSYERLGHCTIAPTMKPPVLVVSTSTGARAFRAALGDVYALTVVDDLARGRALASTGGFLAVVLEPNESLSMAEVVAIHSSASPEEIQRAVTAAIARGFSSSQIDSRGDEVGVVLYDEYIELVRYASTRRYLMALLSRHRGSVTDAARAAKMKRESLHRLLRRHHLQADDFRRR